MSNYSGKESQYIYGLASRTRFGSVIRVGPGRESGRDTTHPPPPQPTFAEAAPSSPTPDLEDPMLALTDRFNAFWDETQEHRVLITQDMEAL